MILKTIQELKVLPSIHSFKVIYFEIIWHLPGFDRVPYHHEKTENISGINRSRGVHSPSVSGLPKPISSCKVTAS